jgi:hypothetical protein
VDGAPTEEPKPDRREQREESTTHHKGNWLACPVLVPFVETPVVAHKCFKRPRTSSLCAVWVHDESLYRQANAVWGRYPTAY